MRNSWVGIPVAIVLSLAGVMAVLFGPSIAFHIAVRSSERPETGPEPSDRQLIAVAERHRAALDDLLRMRREHRIDAIDLQAGTYSRYCARNCANSTSMHFDSTREPLKRYVRDLHDLHALRVGSGYELIVIVWEGGGWRNLPEKGYTWSDRMQRDCVVPELARARWDKCLIAYRPIGGNWYTFQD
jgi:hypothetical protein